MTTATTTERRRPAATIARRRPGRGRPVPGRRQELVRSAARLFGALGYEETTAADVARAAGVSKGTVQHYFAYKEDLLASVRDDLVDHVAGLARRAERTSPPKRRLADVLHAFVTGIVEHLPNALVVAREWGSRRGGGVEGPLRHDECLSFLRCELDRGVAAGRFRGDLDPEVAAHAILGMLLNAADWFDPAADAPDAVAETLARLLAGGLVGSRARVSA